MMQDAEIKRQKPGKEMKKQGKKIIFDTTGKK